MLSGLRQGNTRRSDNSREAENFRVFLVGQRRDGQARILQKLDLAKKLLFAELGKRDLARQSLQCAQVNNKMLWSRIVRVRIRVARDGCDGVESIFRFAVVAERAVAAAHLFHLAQGVRFAAGVAPHLLAFDKKGVPVIDPGINREQPVMWSGYGARHGLAVTGELYIEAQKKQRKT